MSRKSTEARIAALEQRQRATAGALRTAFARLQHLEDTLTGVQEGLGRAAEPARREAVTELEAYRRGQLLIPGDEDYCPPGAWSPDWDSEPDQQPQITQWADREAG